MKMISFFSVVAWRPALLLNIFFGPDFFFPYSSCCRGHVVDIHLEWSRMDPSEQVLSFKGVEGRGGECVVIDHQMSFL